MIPSHPERQRADLLYQRREGVVDLVLYGRQIGWCQVSHYPTSEIRRVAAPAAVPATRDSASLTAFMTTLSSALCIQTSAMSPRSWSQDGGIATTMRAGWVRRRPGPGARMPA